MRLKVDGNDIFASTGGRPFDPSLPLVVFLHGAGFDHTIWALPGRWFAHHGHSVLAPDLPGHGRSGGALIPTISAMADWVAKLIEAAGAPRARLVGHSMGSLIALEAASRHPDKVSEISLIAAGASMKVSPDLLTSAQANHHDAIDMVSIWGLGFRASLGGSRAPGLWMHAGGERVLEDTPDGALFNDLSACNDYTRAIEAAAAVTVPATLILGERDMMTPLKSGTELAGAIKGARRVVLRGAGHMLTAEQPDEVLAALIGK
ncbi:alpha/beta hydrolase [Bradyrhizobium prioriisuperbiae]|uniref:alpha/beta fold hydrolase n=1 Tax=Bradyrhizobium prioriisuperbiae TaxID=2854389 RepID=UPI0028EE0C15|nr:alpha/beta hydrolase [Bradyrhizobium prioritasuperba]